jgi:hypothetical protein
MIEQIMEIYSHIMKSTFLSKEGIKRLLPWVVSLLVLFIIVFPSFSVLYRWLINLFSMNPSSLKVVNVLFETVIIFIGFSFGTGLLFLIRSKCPEMEILIVAIAFGLVIFSSSVFGVISNSCISDLQCDAAKFIMSISMATALSFAGYILIKILKRSYQFLAIPYLVVCIWSSFLLLWHAYQSIGIKPMVQPVLLLLLSTFIFMLYFFGLRNHKIKNE